MTEKELIIQAIKSLDFDALSKLLDNSRSYMDVSKNLFLSRLREELSKYKDLKSYEKVVEGVCDHCNKGCKAYKFKSENSPSLPLFFEEKDNRITDIYLCNAFKEDNPSKEDSTVYFSFFEEEKVGFTPSVEYLLTVQRIERAIEDFRKFESLGLVPIQDIANWHYKCKLLAEELGLNDPYNVIKYKAYEQIDLIYDQVSQLAYNYYKNDLAKDALCNYNKIDKEDERSIVKWLIENKDSYFFPLKTMDSFENSGIVILETTPSLTIDFRSHIDCLFFNDIYYDNYNTIMEKYKPTEKQMEERDGKIEFSLECFLKLHEKYIDLF